MKVRILTCLGIFCFLALSTSGCVSSAGQQGYSGVIPHGGILYLGSTDGKIMAANPSARSQELPFPSSNGEWSFAITVPSEGISCGSSSKPDSIYGTPVVVDGSVCIGTYGGKVLMLNSTARSQNLSFPHLRSGEWIYPRTDDVIGSIVGSPVVVNDTVYVCSSDGKVYALDITYGDEKWISDPLDDKLWTTPMVKDEAIYVSTFDGYIYALSAKDGNLLPWVFEAETGFVSSPVLYEDIVFVGSFDSKLYAVRIGDDKPLWEFLGGNWFWAAPVVSDGIVYAGCLDGKVYALDAERGKESWEFDAGGRIVSSPILVNDSLVVATEPGNVFVINPKTGSGERIKNPDDPQNGKSLIDARIQSSLCLLDGIVYIRAQDNCLYAVDVAKREITLKFPLA
jgi:outer membrane protein assembly factor BamB